MSVNQPELFFKDGKNLILVKGAEMAVIKYLDGDNELFIQSFRRIGKDEIRNLIKKKEIVKGR